jgi:hypothetical protein
MLLRRKPPKLPPGSIQLYPEGTPKPFIVDRRFIHKLRRVRWHFVEKKKRARGYFGRSKVRQYLHRYILILARKFYPEVTFANGDHFDCRLTNLKPYRRYEEGARRQMFKNNTSKRKGVSFHKRKRKWIAMIRTRGHLRHLGYFRTADLAANAYAKAWNLAHPSLPPMPVLGGRQ